MTKEEINAKKNSYKYELNDCNLNIDKYQNSINSCNKIKKYFRAKTPKKQKLSKLFLTFGIISFPLAIFCIFTNPVIGTILLASSIVAFERHFFFRNVTKRFKHCTNFFSKIINSLTEKQSKCVNQKEHALEQICKLENEIPEEVVEIITMMNDEIIENQDSLLFEKCLERTAKYNELNDETTI